jgi:hypothetical protein
LLAELAAAMGVGATALLGLLALVVATARLDDQARERALARHAAEQRLVEIAALDRAGFDAAFAAGANAALLQLDLPELPPAPGRAAAGLVTIEPAPGGPDFAGATLFRVRVEVAWRGAAGDETLALEALVRPAGGGGP